ncbi:MAG TPA: hypothetical protein VIV27_07370 [Halioglobus sp.]
MQVSMIGLLHNINQKLAQDRLELRKSRNSRSVNKCGEYYAVNQNGDVLFAKDVNPELWGRELGILSEYDSVMATAPFAFRRY